MKIRESGMPGVAQWDRYFDPPSILERLELTVDCGDVVEFGCGYGTFTVAAARRVRGHVFALDIEPEMLAAAAARAEAAGLTNIEFMPRDFVGEGTGIADGGADYAMLFNILHGPGPVSLLREALRNLKSGGKAGVIHWNYDPATPRGPPMAIRPRPEDCRRWAEAAGFRCGPLIDLAPYHYGFVLSRIDR
jgi:SAM-dependent methyltransferase